MSHISFPLQNTKTVVSLEAGARVRLDFPETDATYTRDGNNLVISADNGGSTVVLDFFAKQGDSNTLPPLELKDGTSIDSTAFFKALDPTMDVTPAAGPATHAQSSGAGEYSADAGSLIGGIDALGSQNKISWETGSEAHRDLLSGLTTVSGVSADTVTPPAGPALPPTDPATPPAEPFIDSRMVLYMEPDDLALGGGLVFAITGQAQDAKHPADSWAAISAQNGYGSVSLDADGKLVYTLDASYEALLKSGQRLVDYVTYTDQAGVQHVVEIVLTTNPQFDTHDPDLAQTILYETHYTASLNSQGSYDITASAGDDVLSFMAFDGKVAAGLGSDSIVIGNAAAPSVNAGFVSGSSIFLGDAPSGANAPASGAGTQNSLIVYGGMTDSVIYGDAGNDNISIKGGFTGVSSAVIHMGEGDNILDISGQVVNASLTAGNGNDTFTIGSLTNTSIHAGDGQNTITVNGTATNSHIVTGSGDDTITMNGTVSLGSIYTGDGNDRVIINGLLSGTSASSLGGSEPLFVLDTGAGDDYVKITGGVLGTNVQWGDKISSSGGDRPAKDSINGVEIRTGDGNDVVEISGASTESNGASMYKSTIDLGSGNNRLTVSGGDIYELKIAMDTPNQPATFVEKNANNETLSTQFNNVIDLSGTTYSHASNSWGWGWDEFRSGRINELRGTSGNEFVRMGMLGNWDMDLGTGNDYLEITALGAKGQPTGIGIATLPTTIYLGGRTDAEKAAEAHEAATLNMKSFDGQSQGAFNNALVVNATSVTNEAYGFGYNYQRTLISGGDGRDFFSFSGRDTGLHYTNITAGGGDDYLQVRAGGYGLSYGILSMGDGNDVVTVDSTNANVKTIFNSTINLGNGNDVAHLSASGASSTVLAGWNRIYLDNTFNGGEDASAAAISMRNEYTGRDQLFNNVLTVHSVNGTAISETNDTDRTEIYGGQGNDYISIIGTGTGASGDGILGGKISLGDGDNYLHVHGTNYGTGSVPNANFYFYARGGDDTLIFSSDNYSAIGPNASIQMGDGNNVLSVSSSSGAGIGHFYTDWSGSLANTTKIYSGSGDDTITVTALGHAGTDGSGRGINRTDIDTGAGDDLISIHASQSGIAQSHIMMGDGNDTLDIHVDHGGLALWNHTTVDMGTGNDLVQLGGGMSQSSLLLGADDDHLYLNTSISSLSNSIIDGGTGLDTLHLDGSNASMSISDLKSAGIKGFETIDLSGNNSNTLTIDGLLDGISGNELRITGDAGADKVQFGNGTSWTATGTVTDGNTTYDTYENGSGFRILVESGLI